MAMAKTINIKAVYKVAVKVALEKRLFFKEACCFIGYAGASHKPADILMEGAIKSGHRYAKGSNKRRYTSTGRLVLRSMTVLLGIEIPADVWWAKTREEYLWQFFKSHKHPYIFGQDTLYDFAMLTQEAEMKEKIEITGKEKRKITPEEFGKAMGAEPTGDVIDKNATPEERLAKFKEIQERLRSQER